MLQPLMRSLCSGLPIPLTKVLKEASLNELWQERVQFYVCVHIHT